MKHDFQCQKCDHIIEIHIPFDKYDELKDKINHIDVVPEFECKGKMKKNIY